MSADDVRTAPTVADVEAADEWLRDRQGSTIDMSNLCYDLAEMWGRDTRAGRWADVLSTEFANQGSAIDGQITAFRAAARGGRS